MAYIDHMEDLTRKTICRTMARIEAVFLLAEHIPITLALRDFYYMPAIHKLLEQIPIVLPFKKNSQLLGLSHVVHPVASYLTTNYSETAKEKEVLPTAGWDSSVSLP